MKKVLLSIALFVSAIFTVNAQTADEVIAKYITEIGGAEKWAKVQSIKIEGQIEGPIKISIDIKVEPKDTSSKQSSKQYSTGTKISR